MKTDYKNMVYRGKCLVIQKLYLEPTSSCSEKATADIPVVFIDLIDSVLGHLEFGFALEIGIFYLNLLKFQQIKVIWQLFECWPGKIVSHTRWDSCLQKKLSLYIVTRFPDVQKLWSGRKPLPGQPGRWHWVQHPALQAPLFLLALCLLLGLQSIQIKQVLKISWESDPQLPMPCTSLSKSLLQWHFLYFKQKCFKTVIFPRI